MHARRGIVIATLALASCGARTALVVHDAAGTDGGSPSRDAGTDVFTARDVGVDARDAFAPDAPSCAAWDFAPAIAIAARCPTDVAIADLDADGRSDLVVVDSVGTTRAFGWIASMGGGAFAPEQRTDFAPGPRDLVVADLDRDGLLDALVAVASPSSIFSARGRGGGMLSLTASIPVFEVERNVPYVLGAGDVDGDGFVDVAVGLARGVGVHDSPAGELVMCRSTPGGLVLSGRAITETAPPPPSIGVIDGVVDVALGDLDGDGRDEVIALSSYGHLEVFRSDAVGTLSVSTRQDLPASDASRFALGDLDGNGQLDVEVLLGTNGDVRRVFGRGDGTFELGNEIMVIGTGRRAIALADVDADGRDDALVLTSDGVSIANNGRGAPAPVFLSFDPAGIGASDLAVGDVNADGRPDIAVARATPTCDVQLFLSRCL